MLAPTDKAGYNIKGNTIHTALQIAALHSLKTYKLLILVGGHLSNLSQHNLLLVQTEQYMLNENNFH